MTSTAPVGRDGAISVRRTINDHIAEVALRCRPQHGDLFDFLCECGNLRCHAFVPLTISEYRETIPGWVRGHD